MLPRQFIYMSNTWGTCATKPRDRNTNQAAYPKFTPLLMRPGMLWCRTTYGTKWANDLLPGPQHPISVVPSLIANTWHVTSLSPCLSHHLHYIPFIYHPVHIQSVHSCQEQSSCKQDTSFLLRSESVHNATCSTD